jgi:hypothetical protein
MGLRLVREKHMDNSQGDIDPDIFEYLSKLPPIFWKRWLMRVYVHRKTKNIEKFCYHSRGSASKAIL